jgi:hypothetical protein
MKSKVLIYEDRNSATNFEKSVIDTMDQCNQLIELYESFQDFQKITTHSQWIELVTDPGAYYDLTIINGVDLKGNKLPDAGMIAKMFNLDRENYLNATSGKTITTDDCVPCKKLQLKRGSTAISLSGYRSDKDYLIFYEGRFYLATDEIEKHKLSFNTYLENDKQAEYYNHFVTLAKILNEHIKLNKLGNSQLEQLKNITGLLILNNQLIVDDMTLARTIKYIK